MVPMTAIDSMVKLQPGWIYVYVLYYPFMGGAYLLMPTRRLRLWFAAVMALAALISSSLFMLYPTEVPREFYPLNEGDFGVWLLSHIRSIDRSVNCVPSMHVCMSALSAYAYGLLNRYWKWFGLSGALAISYSTMAIKQHYFIDVTTGATLALLLLYSFRPHTAPTHSAQK